MLAIRKRQRQHWDNLKVLVCYNQAAGMHYLGNKLTPSAIAFLGAVMLENIRTNEFCKLKRAIALIGENLTGWKTIQRLIDLGLLETPGYGLYVVTVQGEYFLRNIETELARIVEDKPFSKWRKIRSKDDARLRYIRGRLNAREL